MCLLKFAQDILPSASDDGHLQIRNVGEMAKHLGSKFGDPTGEKYCSPAIVRRLRSGLEMLEGETYGKAQDVDFIGWNPIVKQDAGGAFIRHD